ncbi:TSUP family transporter [Agromyces sp. CFH 90414]|uniref:Probable membrane transporter protein n=1 Tax=Agromyces agglutinans TaxID=2662258 RepID=A0A6I2FA49_9MICO|nr:sulfite exporter TauE/SafE family protein [Agromyces agglutinans]MRG59246.1 TSUP family transporter [Agromyces agglutinans]
MLLAVAVSVLVGAFAQRVTGMGFALVASPALVLLLGPFDGVIVVNLCAVVSSIIILPRVWRHVEWRRFALLVVPAVGGTAVGAFIAASVPGAPLQVVIGALVIAALTTTLLVTRAEHTAHGWPPAVIAGGASGIMNAAAGVGGPALSVYAVATRWSQAGFAATAQPYFVVIGAASLGLKLGQTGWVIPDLGPGAWPWILVALLAGLGLAELLHRRIPHHAARIAVIVIAYLGGAVALLDGALELWG